MASNPREMSSSPGLSSPPKSPESPSSGEAIVVQSKTINYPDLTKSPVQKSSTTKTARAQAAGPVGEPSAPAKQPRKRATKAEKKEKDGDAPPKQRKTRTKKQKDAPEAASSSSAQKSIISEQGTASAKVPSMKQPRINEVMNQAPQSVQLNRGATVDVSTTPASSHIGNKIEAIQKPIKAESPTTSFINHPPPAQSLATSRGQNYDPIRSSTIEVPRPLQLSNPATPAQTSPVKTTGRASASPSIASLINPPSAQTYPTTTAATSSRPSSSASTSKPHISPKQYAFVHQQQKSATRLDSPRSVPPIPTPTVKPPTPPPPAIVAPPTVMEIDSDAPVKPVKSNNSRKPSISTNNSSAVPSPKQSGTKSKNSTSTPTLPPLPGTGTGLLSGSSLFGNGASNEPKSNNAEQTIIIEVPLNGETNKYVNFAKLAEEKYGYNALFPKLAAHRDRLARVAVAGAALENASKKNTSADEMSIDGTDDEGNAGNVEKKASGTESGAPVKKRKTREDNYDKDDPFVDDSELAWAEHASMATDGFFVYSGPLIPATEKTSTAAPNGTKPPSTRGRGRGRGGGPGSRGGRGSRGGAGRGRGAAAGAASAGDSTLNSNGEPEVKRPRGGAATRKPRVTKADRARMEQEKLERERVAQGLTANPAPGATPGMGASMSVMLPKQTAGSPIGPVTGGVGPAPGTTA